MVPDLIAPNSVSFLPIAMGDVLREAATKTVLPRFQNLSRSQVAEKSPGDLVTVADREAEAIIAAGLARLRPSARIVGEEACADNPALLSENEKGEVWIIDPIDGTGNFASGRTPFAMMAALMVGAQIVASAIFDPLGDRLMLAERGSGAWINGMRVDPSAPGRLPSALNGIASDFQRPPAEEARLKALSNSGVRLHPTKRCAGHEYPLVATGECHFALYWRTLIWDHAPGILFLEEAGGKVAQLDGSPFRIDRSSQPLLLAHNEAIWENIASALQN